MVFSSNHFPQKSHHLYKLSFFNFFFHLLWTLFTLLYHCMVTLLLTPLKKQSKATRSTSCSDNSQLKSPKVSKSEMGSRNFLDLLAKNFDVLAGPLIALVYPLYASIKAIETRSRADDQQWLTYWVLYSLITLFELTFANVLEWFPIWPYAKLIGTCWLVLPHFNGAAYVYEHFVRPFYRNPQTSKIWFIPQKKNIFREPDDILTAAERYIEQNGTEAFERLISRGDREARARRSDYMIFDDDYRY